MIYLLDVDAVASATENQSSAHCLCESSCLSATSVSALCFPFASGVGSYLS